MNFNAEISSSFGNTVFSGCTALTVVNFGENVSSVWRNSSNAHYGPAVQEFNVAEANPNLKSIDGVLYNKYNSNSTDFDRLSLYPVAKEDKSFTIPDGIKYTGSNAFANNKFLEEVTLPYGMVSLGENTFYNCTSLAILNYNCQLGNMDSNVFEGCTSLATVNVGKDVKSILRNTTNSCYGPAVQAFNVDPANTNLKSVDGVIYAKSSDDSTDYDALCLYPVAKEDTSYTVPESINYLYGNCISGNSYLEEVTILAKDAKGPYSSSTLLNSLPSLKTFRFPVSMRFNYSTVNNVPALEKLSITEGTPDTEVISYITTSTSISGSFEIEIGKGVTNIDISPFVNSVSSYTVDPENDVFFLGEDGALYRHISDGINGGTADPSGSETELVDIPIQAEITEFTPLNTTTLIRSITNKNVQKIDLSGLSQYLFARKSTSDLSYATMNCSALEEIDLGSGMINVPAFRMDSKLAALHLFPSEATDLRSSDYLYNGKRKGLIRIGKDGT